MNAKDRPHSVGLCGILTPHKAVDHKASDRLRGVVRGRIQDPNTKRWYKDGYAPFQLAEGKTNWAEYVGRHGDCYVDRAHSHPSYPDDPEPTCDICGTKQDESPDWNGETGCHQSCEAGVP